MLANIIFFVVVTFALSQEDCMKDCCASLTPRQVMNYTYYQDTGRFTGGQGDYVINTVGYSGADEGKLNPEMQCVKFVGPLPSAQYKLGYCKNYMRQTTWRPCTFFLDPQELDKMCGRDDFFIHGCQCCTKGDLTEPPIDGCSQGCLVMNYDNRVKLRVGDNIKVERYDPLKGMENFLS